MNEKGKRGGGRDSWLENLEMFYLCFSGHRMRSRGGDVGEWVCVCVCVCVGGREGGGQDNLFISRTGDFP